MSGLCNKDLWKIANAQDAKSVAVAIDLGELATLGDERFDWSDDLFRDNDLTKNVLCAIPKTAAGINAISINSIDRIMQRDDDQVLVVCYGDTETESNVRLFDKATFMAKDIFAMAYDTSAFNFNASIVTNNEVLKILPETNVMEQEKSIEVLNNITSKSDSLYEKLCDILNIQYSIGEIASYKKSETELKVESPKASVVITGTAHDVTIQFTGTTGEKKFYNSMELGCFGINSVTALTKRIVRALKDGSSDTLASSTSETPKQVISKLARTLEHNDKLKVKTTLAVYGSSNINENRIDIDGVNGKNNKYITIEPSAELDGSDSICVSFFDYGDTLASIDVHLRNTEFANAIGILASYYVNNKAFNVTGDAITISKAIESIILDVNSVTNLCRENLEDVYGRYTISMHRKDDIYSNCLYIIIEFNGSQALCSISNSSGDSIFDTEFNPTEAAETCACLIKVFEFLQ